MKNLSLTTLLILITLGFSSCSQDDNTFLEEPSADALLESYKIQRVESGKYSLDYELRDGVATDNNVDEKTNTKNINLYLSDIQNKSNLNENLVTQNGQFIIGFNDTEKNKNHTITVLDNNIHSKGQQSENIQSLEMSGNTEGAFDLKFSVKDGVEVDIIYDGDRNVYEVHLTENPEASQSNFEETFVKEDGVALQIEFLNYSSESRNSVTREPVVIIED